MKQALLKIIDNRLKALSCPSCNKTEFMVGFGSAQLPRIILDCFNCGYRLSLPTNEELWEKPEFSSMPLEFSEIELRR